MDEYEGIVILATNLRNNMDEAFTRRMHATVDFPFPEEEYRRRIFEGIFPKQAPLSSDVDFAFLARQFKLTGGNIKNIALYAAFLAAEDNKHIGMAQIIRGTKRELDKIGRLCSKADFGPYYDLMKEADV
jgi:ATP-dependent 26S proteasome regulatory subunit